MTRTLVKLLSEKLAELNRGDSPSAIIAALTHIAGDTDTDIRVATEATARVAELLSEECRGLVITKRGILHDVMKHSCCRAALEARSVASSQVMHSAHQGRLAGGVE
jgi:hypothetical protein